MNPITKEYVEEVMAHIKSSHKPFDNGRVLVTFHGGGSRDTIGIFCENQEIAYISSKDWESVWTKWVIDPSKMTTELGKALVAELSKDFKINWRTW